MDYLDYLFKLLLSSDYVYMFVHCTYTVPKTKGWRWFKRYGTDFSRSHEGKEENPRNYNGLGSRERKNTFHITLNQRQLLSFGTVYTVSKVFIVFPFLIIC